VRDARTVPLPGRGRSGLVVARAPHAICESRI